METRSRSRAAGRTTSLPAHRATVRSFHRRGRARRQAAPVLRECQICREEKDKATFVQVSAKCMREALYCGGCLAKHVEAEVHSKGNTMSVTCPKHTCRVNLEHGDIQRLATGSVFEYYDRQLVRHLLATVDDFRWCKNATCGSGQEHVGGAALPIMWCNACGRKSCFVHDVPWHDTLSCEQYDGQLQGEDRANSDVIMRTTKPCPKCARRIEKNSGCNHMTCRRPGGCGHEFCWLCLSDYSSIIGHGNHRHRPTCQYYAYYRGEETGSSGGDGSEVDSEEYYREEESEEDYANGGQFSDEGHEEFEEEEEMDEGSEDGSEEEEGEDESEEEERVNVKRRRLI